MRSSMHEWTDRWGWWTMSRVDSVNSGLSGHNFQLMTCVASDAFFRFVMELMGQPNMECSSHSTGWLVRDDKSSRRRTSMARWCLLAYVTSNTKERTCDGLFKRGNAMYTFERSQPSYHLAFDLSENHDSLILNLVS